MRYTAVFEFEEHPRISRLDSWLGGKLCCVQFSDAIAELEVANEMIEDIERWYHTDGSKVSELAKIIGAVDE